MASWTRALFFALVTLVPAEAAEKSITILGASSLTDVLPEVVALWKHRHPDVDVKLSFDGSSRLASEIDQGVPADLFLSADTDWMDHLAKGGKILPETRRDILKNEIVLIVPSGAPAPKSADDLKGPTFKKIALAGENVPISKYARAAFEHLQVWSAIEPKVVRGENVRTSLKWVDQKEVDAGVVYRTDAIIDKRVKIAFTFPKDAYPPVTYPGAVLRSSSAQDLAKSFLEFCGSPEARAIFRKNGFE